MAAYDVEDVIVYSLSRSRGPLFGRGSRRSLTDTGDGCARHAERLLAAECLMLPSLSMGEKM
jgi:hypothetical protein